MSLNRFGVKKEVPHDVGFNKARYSVCGEALDLIFRQDFLKYRSPKPSVGAIDSSGAGRLLAF